MTRLNMVVPDFGKTNAQTEVGDISKEFILECEMGSNKSYIIEHGVTDEATKISRSWGYHQL